jgi:hypothetical protein
MYDGYRPEGGAGNGVQRLMPASTARSKLVLPDGLVNVVDDTTPSDFNCTRNSAKGFVLPDRTGGGNDTPGFTQDLTLPA